MFPGYAIPNTELSDRHIPPPSERWDEPLLRFALSFDGYQHAAHLPGNTPVSRLATFARPVVQTFAREGCLPESLSLSDLRACLFWEERRDRHAGTWELHGKQCDYIHALLEGIRAKVQTGERE